MEPLLLLVHRIPFPPNKGDKVRSFHLLEFLASRYRVHLGTFVDSTEDLVHIPRLQEYCASSKVIELRPAFARIRSIAGLVTGAAMTLRYYRDAVFVAQPGLDSASAREIADRHRGALTGVVPVQE